MATEYSILNLPAELQLHIASYIVGDAQNIHHARHLLDLALTCRQLGCITQEALCLSPILPSSKAHHFLRFLFAHPDLAAKIKTLTIETQETRKHHANPVVIAHLEPKLLDHCKRHVRTLPVRQYDQDIMIALLKQAQFETHGPLLTLLLTMLPHLTRLHLGGSILLNLPFVSALLSFPPSTSRSTPATDLPDLTWLLPLLGPRLTALELPIDLRRTIDTLPQLPQRTFQLPTHFPNLRWLSIPHMATVHRSRNAAATTTCADVIPAALQTLILADARGLLDGEAPASARFPALEKVVLYHRFASAQVEGEVVAKLAEVEVEVEEHVPACCLRSGDEFWHPWRYGVGEGEREVERHHAYDREAERE